MRPFSELVPKELVPLGARPALDWVLDEALGAGIEEIVLVVAPGKPLVRACAERWAAEQVAPPRLVEVVQEHPTGLGHALLACRERLMGEAFGLLLPDNICLGRNKFARMVALHRRSGLDVVGVLALDARHDGEYGASGLFEAEPYARDALRITRLREKASGRLRIGRGEVVHRTCGRYVCAPDALDWIARSSPGEATELSEVPAYQAIAAARGLIGVVLPAPVVDVGHPSGVLAGSAWLDRRLRRERARKLRAGTNS
jgi:UTP--glucose-1-phosphate uridylyltransferase